MKIKTNDIKKVNVEIPLSFEVTLISDAEVKEQQRVAKADKKLTNDVNAQIYVVNKGPDFWKKILSKCAEKRISVNMVQEQDLKVAITMFQKRPPNSFESKRLMKFLEYVKEEGVDIDNL